MRHFFLILVTLLIFSGCGYGFRTSKVANPWPGVKKIYVPVFKNKSLYYGAEAAFTKALVTRLNSTGRWTVINSRKNADAIIQGTILDSGTQVQSVTASESLPGCKSVNPDDDPYTCVEDASGKDIENIAGESDALIVNQYNAFIQCQIKVTQTSDGAELFDTILERSESFSAANRKGKGGSTNSLVNLSRRDGSFVSMSDTLMSQAVALMLQAF